MKRFLSVSVAGAVAALALAIAPAAAQQRVGFVNTQRVLAEAPGLQQVQATLQRELPGLRAPLDSLEQRLTAQQNQLQQQSATLSEAVRTQRTNELQQQFQAYQQRAQQLQQQAQRREAELVQPVMTAINAAIEAERRAANYDYIMDSSGNGIVAVNPTLDLTDRVLARLRGGAPAAAPRQ